ncbi:MAG: hypothetical protein ACI8QZ_002693 [Chlamydiales bacterium]|jgi:hypothetical protein
MKLLSVLPLLLTLPALAVQDSGTPAAEAPQETSEFGEPVIVNGRRITDRAIKRFLIYGVGNTVLETDRLAILIDQEMKHRARVLEGEYLAEMFPGKDAAALSEAEHGQIATRIEEALAKYQLDEDYVTWVREEEISSFTERYPTLDLPTEVRRGYDSYDLYQLQVRLTLAFDTCFFPGDPDDWPPLTKEAVYSGSTEVDLVQDMKESWDRRVRQAEDLGNKFVRREDELFFGMLRDFVISMLGSAIYSETAVDGLDEEFVLSMDGDGWSVKLETDELYKRVAPHVSEQDMRIAKRWLATMAAAEDRLEKEGYLVSLEEHYAHLEKTAAELENSMFTMDFLAVTGHGFPSTQAFKNHLRAFESYHHLVTATLLAPSGDEVPPVLIEYLPLANKVLGIAAADAEVLLVGAFDQPTFQWKENGWEWAKQESDRLNGLINDHLDKLDAAIEGRRTASENGENYEPEGGVEPIAFEQFWAELLDLHSGFWDPPMPTGGKMPAMEGLQQKGRFGKQPRNDLDRSVGGSSFYKALTGSSIADRVFHDMEVGDVGGPFRGPQGYYIVYLRSRTGATNPIGYTSKRHLSLLEEEYVRQTFAEYVQEALRNADVSGVEDV